MFNHRLDMSRVEEILTPSDDMPGHVLANHCNGVAVTMLRFVDLRLGDRATVEDKLTSYFIGMCHDLGRNFSTNSFEPEEHALIGAQMLRVLTSNDEHVIQRVIRDHGNIDKLSHAILCMNKIQAFEHESSLGDVVDSLPSLSIKELMSDRQYFELLIDLDRADMLVMPDGSACSYGDRLADIESRYAASPDVVDECHRIVKAIQSYDELWSSYDMVCSYYSASKPTSNIIWIRELFDKMKRLKEDLRRKHLHIENLEGRVKNLKKRCESLEKKLKDSQDLENKVMK